MRRYNCEELERHFGEREYFRQMTSDQVSNILGYIQAKTKCDGELLKTALVGSEQNTIELSDAEVYKRIQ
jgi:hypothetical protein